MLQLLQLPGLPAASGNTAAVAVGSSVNAAIERQLQQAGLKVRASMLSCVSTVPCGGFSAPCNSHVQDYQ
jgi:hypothetical protein